MGLVCAATAYAAPINLTGTWQPKNWTLKIALLQEGDRVWEPVYLSEDAQEGPRAFREKRAPAWRGR